MSDTVLVALFSLIGTLIGSLSGILAANKLINYRVAQLEKKVEKHNSVIERTFKLESGLEDLKDEVHMFHKGH